MSAENQIRRLARGFPRTRRRRKRRSSAEFAAAAEREALAAPAHGLPHRLSPSCSVIICTRNRPEDLALCLDSVVRLKSTSHEIIVVDNAPSSPATQNLVREYQIKHEVRYELEMRPGLDVARNRGVLAARGDIVAFTDDDCVVDENWVEALLRPYQDPEVACVTGLVAPWEIETRAQELFEFHYGGMSRGLARFTVDFSRMRSTDAGKVGTGANMSFRKSVLFGVGLFNEALDCGMPTQSGGDTYAFYKILAGGYTIAYEPDALVWHRHRRDYRHLMKQMYGYGVGVASFLTACLVEDHDLSALGSARDWLRYHHFRRLHLKARGQFDFPVVLLLAEFLGALAGPWSYYKARRIALRSQQPVDKLLLTSPALASSFTELEEDA